MKILMLIHVLSAIIGVGPTFFGHVLTRSNQTVEDLRMSYRFFKYLEMFPKIGGSLAVISGLTLYFLGNYGSFTQLWLIGSLVLYILIQIVVIGLIAPKQKRIENWLFDEKQKDVNELDQDIVKAQNHVNKLFYFASFMGVVLFIFMILKPIVLN
ncbi:DUF2269 family protein [Bacillus sp. AFS041924]|uniref:DUF2269 family protein n=1 Tax=Bacillus sp. AFS041924 TaxID=2033503 RepID=UPI000BFB4F7A|nr:DUF2269 family protein [Bacillus sp. AFS041924]PGS53674.1 hypothetical protein COC46_06675 [Bacillus sp. AFS041924]